MRLRLALAFTALLIAQPCLAAGGLLDSIRSVDLNDYALGVAVKTRQSPYIGGENSRIAYPYLTSFTHWSMNDKWFVSRDGGYGIRWVTDSEWEFGVIARVRTLGLGNSQADELVGIADRKWTVETGPTVGYRGWPVHINWTYWGEVTDRHDGFVSDLAFAYPIETATGYIVPRVHAVYESSGHGDYYYSVSEAESMPGRPAYVPGSIWNTKAEVKLGYALAPNWLLSATVGSEWLGSEIADSPIVGRDQLWFARLGVAYNADVFNPRSFDSYTRRLPSVDLRIGAFFSSVSTKLARDSADGVPGVEIDLEDEFGAPDNSSTIEADATWRIGEHSQLEMGYFDLVRSGSTVLTDDLEFGDVFFGAGTDLSSKVEYSSLRIGYTFFLMRDTQKEVGVMGGVHLTSFAASLAADGALQTEKSRSSTPLPVIGLNGALFFGDATTLRARIHIFRTDFDQHEGSLNYAALDLERRFRDAFSLGVGYNLYNTKLTSRDQGLNGRLNIRHYGPVLFATFGF